MALGKDWKSRSLPFMTTNKQRKKVLVILLLFLLMLAYNYCGMYKFSDADDPIFLLEQTKYGQFFTKDKNIYEGHKKLRNIFEGKTVVIGKNMRTNF